jgi:glycosyltransferase involved in cell wall biosynthesis
MPTTFTIAIPTHNRRETVLLAAHSALAQTRPPDQLLVLCDGCTDGTADALRGLGCTRLQALELPKGPGYAYEHRNRALELALGEAIIWLADDDLLTPDHLEHIGKLWDTGRFDLVQSDGVVIHPDDSLAWFGSDWSLAANRPRVPTSNSNPMASISVRVALARAVGGWDATRERSADWDLWRRALAAEARVARSPEPTVLHFRATGRDQAWPLRVRQNAAWLAQLQQPECLLDLRIRFYRADAERQLALRQGLQTFEERADHLEQRGAALDQDVSRLRTELAEVRRHSAALSVRLVAAEAESARLARVLRQIYDGGWWRLRNRLLPLLRLLGRGA